MTSSKASIDKTLARSILYEEAAKAAAGYVDEAWEEDIEAFSETCKGTSKTHVAFLGTALLAKCCDSRVDVFAVKASAGEHAYSARGLCHQVLVPNAPELDINLGVTGREPLNNQPYFRIERVTRDIPVRASVRPALNQLCDLLERLQLATQEHARVALRAFIAVRQRHGTRYSDKITPPEGLSPKKLIRAIVDFVAEESEGGRRAQAIVGGLMDLHAGEDRVMARRVNDPSRDVPGDVAVAADRESGAWERILEVRDKPVSREDLYLLVKRAADAGVGEAIIVAVAPNQPEIPVEEARAWAAQRGVSLSVFLDWERLVQEVLLWSRPPQLMGARNLPGLILSRLVELEVSQAAVESWRAAVEQEPSPPQENS